MKGFGVTMALAGFALSAAAQSRAPHPDFTGVWNSATATPLERPARLKDKAVFTPEEAAQFERETAAQNQDPTPEQAARSVGTYNVAFREFGAHVVKTLRTSIITEPADGRLPPLTPAAAEAKQLRTERLRHPDTAQDTGLQDQCLLFPTSVPPMIPYSYNSNYQFIDTGDAVVIHAEMIHETRVVRMNGGGHLAAGVTQWLGDSVGRWEGSTLVVETTNFNDARGYFGEAGGMFGWDRGMRVVERFSLLDAKTMMYRFEVENPASFTAPFKGEYTLERGEGPIFEYACHEGNYALPNLLRGFRADEARAAAPK